MVEFRKSGASRAGHGSRVNSQDNLIFNQPSSLVTLNLLVEQGHKWKTGKREGKTR